MKRLFGTFTFVLLSGAVMAQAPFTIVRPADGSKVRETVKILIPKNSVPPGGYIGIFLGGKFIEATIPPLDKTKKFYEYDLDTKGRKIDDGKLSLEAVLYEDYQDQPRIVNRSSVEVTVQNSAESKIPANGIYLRYKWIPGTEAVYDYTAQEIIDTGDSKLNSLGGRANEVTSEPIKYRLLYATENRYNNGDGLVRMQALPDKGKDTTMVPIVGSEQLQKFHDYEMASIYQRLSKTGLEVFGSVPVAFPLEGTSGEAYTTLLWVSEPLPTLPTKKVKPGSSWTARFQAGALDLSNLYEMNSVVEHFIARGEFKDVEWEMGHPCARIVNSIEQAQTSAESKKLKAQGRDFTGGNKIKVEETIWFALDRGDIVKIDRNRTIETEITTQNNFGGTNGGPSGPGQRGGGKHIPTPPGIGGPPGGDKITIPDIAQTAELQQRSPKGGLTPPGIGPGGPGSFGPGGRGGMGQRGRGTGGTAPASTTFVRLSFHETYILEQ